MPDAGQDKGLTICRLFIYRGGLSASEVSKSTGPSKPAGKRGLPSILKGKLVLVSFFSGDNLLSPTNRLFQLFTTSMLSVFSPSFNAFEISTRKGAVHTMPHEIPFRNTSAILFSLPMFSQTVLFLSAV